MKEETTYDEFQFHLERKKREYRNYPLSPQVHRMFRELPCYSEWLRYVQFHNYALDVVDLLPGRILYFEEFLRGPLPVAQDLLKYLHLPQTAKPPPFGKKRAKGWSFYTAEESRLATRLVRTIATDETWDALGVYMELEDWYDPDEVQGIQPLHATATAAE